MTLTIYPAIDIRGGKCVRLLQGNYSLESKYYDNPLEPAAKWYEAGADWLHIIDLDGAKTGKPENLKVIKDILSKFKINIQIGGGIRTKEAAKAYLDSGAQRVIIGSAALKNIKLVETLIEEYGDKRIIVSLDGRNDQAFSEGWLEQSGKNLLDAAQNLAEKGIKTFIYTDIEKDGTLSGPNIKQALNIAARTNKEVIVAGGIGTTNDVLDLVRYQNLGITGVVIGRALYTGDINLSALIAQLKEG
ncbi:MAG: phosphoribosylformimino-5-aminoimidazole carboxamide ribotide isomerase [Clostridia bacterium]|jgi:phosphoribosylformimino-5-aminoimidazole carboxamide ribotide isomerase|nr:phosphoribosylformimino-5-aminoimidazole carboxamide ribotide isomerase [Clostridia bacterium]MDN5322066.1 phosphoribosylformimino-5-aminoimidazole carboxamide ribotide isomerase [Clostridia bacterium]